MQLPPQKHASFLIGIENSDKEVRKMYPYIPL